MDRLSTWIFLVFIGLMCGYYWATQSFTSKVYTLETRIHRAQQAQQDQIEPQVLITVDVLPLPI